LLACGGRHSKAEAPQKQASRWPGRARPWPRTDAAYRVAEYGHHHGTDHQDEKER
jgi:hypothetical protein